MLPALVIAGALVGLAVASRSWMRAAPTTRGGYVDRALVPGLLLGAFCAVMAVAAVAVVL
jgi:hypothetical protein